MSGQCWRRAPEFKLTDQTQKPRPAWMADKSFLPLSPPKRLAAEDDGALTPCAPSVAVGPKGSTT